MGSSSKSHGVRVGQHGVSGNIASWQCAAEPRERVRAPAKVITATLAEMQADGAGQGRAGQEALKQAVAQASPVPRR